MNVKDSIRLGDKVKDRYSPFEGYVHGVAVYITGCTQFLVKPRTLDKDGKVAEGMWLDESAVKLVSKGELVDEAQPPGGPSAADAAGLKV